MEEAIVVLGCAIRRDTRGLTGAAARRVAHAASVFREVGGQPLVVASGGRAWLGVVEADALAEELTRLGVPADRIVRERCSLSTRDNARYTAEVLGRRG